MTFHQGEEPPSDIEGRYREVLRRVEKACARCGRDPVQVKVVVVSKTQPLERVRRPSSPESAISVRTAPTNWWRRRTG